MEKGLITKESESSSSLGRFNSLDKEERVTKRWNFVTCSGN